MQQSNSGHDSFRQWDNEQCSPPTPSVHRAIHVMATMLPLPEALIVLNAWGGCGDPDVTPQPLAYGTGIPTCSPACGDQGGNNYYTPRTSLVLAEHAAEHPCGERRSGHGAADPIRLSLDGRHDLRGLPQSRSDLAIVALS
jgi:hypothetical protein